MRITLGTVLAGIALAAAACTGGTGEPPSAAGQLPPPSREYNPYAYRPCNDTGAGNPGGAAAPVSPGGIWRGTITNEVDKATAPFTALVSEDGRFWFRDWNDHYVGSVTVAGTGFSGGGTAYSGGSSWHDGSLASRLDVAGSISARKVLAGSFGMASGDAGCFELVYAADVYEKPGSLADVEGNWSARDDWGITWTLTVDPGGRFLASDPYGTCHLAAGQLTRPDERYNLLEIETDAEACGVPVERYTGLAYVETIFTVSGDLQTIVLTMHNSGRALTASYYR